MKRIETLEELTFQACTTYLKKNKLRIEDLAGLPGVLVSSFCHRIPLNTKNFFLFFERAIEFSDEVSYHKCMQFARRSFPVLVKVKGEAGLREILGDDVYDEILKEQKDVELFKKKCYREGKILERENVHQTEGFFFFFVCFSDSFSFILFNFFNNKKLFNLFISFLNHRLKYISTSQKRSSLVRRH